MNGFREVGRMKQRLDATFERIGTIDPDSLELRSDFAKYLCVLVSGYIETALAQMIQEHARQNGSPTPQRFVESKMDKFTNANPQKIIELLGSFDKEWRREIEKFLVGDQKDAISSIVKNRHLIAHGRDSQITYHNIRDYYGKAQRVVDRVQELCSGDSRMNGN